MKEIFIDLFMITALSGWTADCRRCFALILNWYPGTQSAQQKRLRLMRVSSALSRRALRGSCPGLVCAAAMLLVCGGGLFVPALRAQSASTAPIDVLFRDADQLSKWLLDHSHDVAASAARVGQAEAAWRASQLHPNPQLNVGLAGVTVGTTNPAGLGFGDTVNYGASVSQAIELRKRGPRAESARLRWMSERFSSADDVLAALADAREAIGRIFYLRSRQAALEDSLAAARQSLEIQRARFDRGDLSGTDLDRVQLDTQVLETDLALSRAEYAESLTACQNILFVPCDPGSGDMQALLAFAQAAAPAATPEAALAARPDLRALTLLEQSAAQDAVLASHRGVPDPVLSVGYTRDRLTIAGNQPHTLLFGVTFALPFSDRGQHDEVRARAQAVEFHETAAAIRERARTSAAALTERQTALTQTLRTLQADGVPKAESIFASTMAAVEQGELSTTDLLLARRNRTDLVLKVMDIQFQLFLTQNELRHVLGLDAPIVQRLQGGTWPTP
jgi:outer membrane protein TolC